jgi:KDO2-lipid IV(A) lauroyltransferase
VVDDWILRGRKRFGTGRPIDRKEGFKPVLAALRAGEPLCLLPDMNYEPKDSVFVPFYGVLAATVPSLSRVARLGRAKVVAMVARITPQGYEIEISPAWPDYPSDDLVSDTALMNLRLQTYIDVSPAQYYWVHKRFKDRPAGEMSPY